MLKALVAEQMLVTILTDVAARFRSRCMKLCLKLGSKDNILCEVGRSSRESRKHPEETTASVPGKQQHLLPEGFPSRYFKSTLLPCREPGPELCKFSFCPTRFSCVPCHFKFGTEYIAQILLHKQCVEARKSFGRDGRKDFNEWV